MSNLPTSNNGFSLVPATFAEAERYAQLICRSSFVPDTFKGKAGDVLIAIQMGQEIGLQPLQALQNIAVINGRPCVWGDALLALVQSHQSYEYIKEEFDEENMTATCKLKRKGCPECVKVFSVEDAKQARLWGKRGPWTDYPKRMLQLRARGFALRDAFADALYGIITREEAEDYDQSAIKSSQLKVVGSSEAKSCSTYTDTSVEKIIRQPKPQEKINDYQCAEIKNLLEIKDDVDEDKFFARYQVEKIEDLTSEQFMDAAKILHAKKDKDVPI